MNFVRLLVLSGLAAALLAHADAAEDNVWPLWVSQKGATGKTESWESIGPLFYQKPGEPGETWSGFRPIYVRATDANHQITKAAVVLPLYIYRADSESYHWNFLLLITGSGRKAGSSQTAHESPGTFDIWPIWFSRDTGSPETSYRALFPIAGTIKERLGYERLSWVIWPLYFRTESKGATTVSTPWPILRFTSGTEHGFTLWPLFGRVEKPGVWERQFYLWPLIWNNTRQPFEDDPAGTPPTRQVGVLPFYAGITGPGLVSRTYVWPFFGYLDRTKPDHYHESHYLWPLWVQAHGDNRYINRWAPFYTHSVIKGYDKTWVLWPLVRRARWTEDGLKQTKTQLLYFIYRSYEQRSPTNPRLAPASKTHFWPLYSSWDNGAGQRQFQFFSPFEVFFPDNEFARQAWSPLAAIFRYDQRAPGDTRWSALWSLVTWHRTGAAREFHLGPLLSVKSGAPQGRTALLTGVLGWKREPGAKGWSFFWFDFPSKVNKVPVAAR